MVLSKEQKKEVAAPYVISEKDTGSSKVQVAVLTRRISDLTEHLKANPKDYACQRGLQMLVGQRRRFLRYIKDRVTPEDYKVFIGQLGIRK